MRLGLYFDFEVFQYGKWRQLGLAFKCVSFLFAFHPIMPSVKVKAYQAKPPKKKDLKNILQLNYCDWIPGKELNSDSGAVKLISDCRFRRYHSSSQIARARVRPFLFKMK